MNAWSFTLHLSCSTYDRGVQAQSDESLDLIHQAYNDERKERKQRGERIKQCE
jgi:hypothetical protein